MRESSGRGFPETLAFARSAERLLRPQKEWKVKNEAVLAYIPAFEGDYEAQTSEGPGCCQERGSDSQNGKARCEPSAKEVFVKSHPDGSVDVEFF